jgi:hypothetical protein
MLSLVPITQREAFAFVKRHHRHHKAPRGALLQVGIEQHDVIVGVAVVGRPLARHLQDGYTAEVARVCVLDGIMNGCSMLYGACWRACRALGYRKLVTYTLPSEGGGELEGERMDAHRRSRWWLVVAHTAAASRYASDADEAPMGSDR